MSTVSALCKGVIAIAFSTALLAFSTRAGATTPAQQWVGEFRLDGQTVPLVLHDRSATKDTPSVVDLPTMGAREVPLARFDARDGRASFELDGPPGKFVFDGAIKDRTMQGKVAKGDSAGEFTLHQLHAISPALAAELSGSYEIEPGHVIDLGIMDDAGGLLVFVDQKTLREGALYALTDASFVSGPTLGVPYPFAIRAEFKRDAAGAVTGLRWSEGGREFDARKVAPHRVEEVTVVNGDVTLKGSLTLPAGKGPHPAVVFAHGAGNSTRNLAFWNMYFVRLGMAVLSLDKRGAGQSTGDWHEADMDVIAGDWLAGVAMLKQRADIDPKRIGVHGSSQGGWTAPLMAARSQDIAFVIVRAGSGANVSDTMVHEIGWTARDAGASEAVALEAEAAARTMFDFSARKAPWSEVSAFVASQKDKPWAQYVWPLNWSDGGWGFKWSGLNVGYDATVPLATVRVPVLWFLADLDHNVPSDVSEQRLLAVAERSKHADFQVKRLMRTGHGFTVSESGNNNDFHTASHFAPGYFDTMERWLRERRFID